MRQYKISMPSSPLEQRAYQQRLERLGIAVKSDGTIDEASVSRLKADGKTGLDALAAVTGASGVLDAQAAGQLEVNLKWFERINAKGASISPDQSNAVRATALALDGLAKTLDVTADRASRNEPPSKEQLEKIGRSLEHVRTQWASLVNGEGYIGNVDPAALSQFVGSFSALNRAASALGIELSHARSALLEGAPPTSKDLSSMLAGLSSTVHQLDLIRDAALLVAGRPGPEATKSLDELLASVKGSLAPAQQAAYEGTLEKAARVKEMLEKVPGLIDGATTTTLAAFVTAEFSANIDLKKSVGPALLLLSYDIPQSFAPPNGRHQLIITARGLRTVSADGGATRTPTASELTGAGLSWSQIDAATKSLLQRVDQQGTKIETLQVPLNKDDRLYTNGNQPSVDQKQLTADWSAALKHSDAKTRAGEMARVFNEYGAMMSAGELRDFAKRALSDMGRQDVRYRESNADHAEAQLVVMDAIIAHLGRFPFTRSNLEGINDLSGGVRDRVYSNFHDSAMHQRWLNRWHMDSKFEYD